VGRSDNRAVALGEVSRSLKALARELDIPVMACSQLSRAIEQRPNHRPLLSDLRESGSIEQDADVVSFIHREDQYTTREEWERKFPTEQYPENIAEIIVSKHRNGPVGTVPLYFRNDRVRFETLTEVSQARSMEYAPT
jgi:replicative DNA helicase